MLEAGYGRPVRVEQSADFLGDRREDLARVDPAGHQRGHPVQRRLLLYQEGQFVPAGLQRALVLRVRDRGATRSVNSVIRCSVSGGSGPCPDPTAMAPHSRPSTWIGRATADRSPSRR